MLLSEVKSMAEPQDNPTSNPPRKNQRRSRRQAPKSTTKARAVKNSLGLGGNIAVGVLDVSEMGIRLILKENLPKGHEFEVTLESISSRPVKCLARIVWSVAMADGNFCVGAAFSKNMNYTDLAALTRL